MHHCLRCAATLDVSEAACWACGEVTPWARALLGWTPPPELPSYDDEADKPQIVLVPIGTKT